MTIAFFIPTVNLMGAGCLNDAADSIQSQGFKKGLIVTDKVLNQIGVVKQVQDLLADRAVETVVFDGTQPNPTIGNVELGLELLTENDCDFVIYLGGGSPHDFGIGIALVAANGGKIADYEGVDQSAKPPR
jgi:alcohol dehydrogenase